MNELRLIKNTLSNEDRIQARIDAFSREIMNGEDNTDYINQVLQVCLNYMYECENEDIYHASIKIKESIFYLNAFMVS